MRTLETFAARYLRANPGGGLRDVARVAYDVATCRGPAPLYADEPILAAITHRRECWQMLLMARRTRRRLAAAPGRIGGDAA